MPGDASHTLTIQRLHEWAQAAPLHVQWNHLVLPHSRSLRVPSFFQTYEWNHAWWETFGNEHELLILTATQNDVLVGIAPLMISKKRFPIPSRVISFIGSSNHASDYCSLIYDPSRPEIARAFTKWIRENFELWTEIHLTNLLQESPELPIIQEELGSGRYLTQPTYHCDSPSRLLSSAEENLELVNRKSLKRHFNGIKNMGAISYRHLETADEVLLRMPEFFEQHIERRAAANDVSLFHDPQQKEFYLRLIHELLPTGWLKFFSVDLDGKSVAYHLGFEFSNRFYWYKPTFDVKYVKKSPGEVLLKTLFEYAISKNLREFDFTVGNEGFKYRFSNHIRKVYQYRIYRCFPHYLLFRLERSVRSLVRAIRNSVQSRV